MSSCCRFLLLGVLLSLSLSAPALGGQTCEIFFTDGTVERWGNVRLPGLDVASGAGYGIRSSGPDGKAMLVHVEELDRIVVLRTTSTKAYVRFVFSKPLERPEVREGWLEGRQVHVSTRTAGGEVVEDVVDLGRVKVMRLLFYPTS